MKVRIFSVFLLIGFTVPAVIYYFSLKVQGYNIKAEVKSILKKEKSDNSITVLKFRISEIKSILKWEDPKEFEYNGVMYDIISTKTEGDSIFYRCYCDLKESFYKQKFYVYLSSFAGKTNKGSISSSASKVLRIFSLPVDFPALSIRIGQVKNILGSYNLLIDLFYIIPPTPPPE